MCHLWAQWNDCEKKIIFVTGVQMWVEWSTELKGPLTGKAQLVARQQRLVANTYAYDPVSPEDDSGCIEARQPFRFNPAENDEAYDFDFDPEILVDVPVYIQEILCLATSPRFRIEFPKSVYQFHSVIPQNEELAKLSSAESHTMLPKNLSKRTISKSIASSPSMLTRLKEYLHSLRVEEEEKIDSYSIIQLYNRIYTGPNDQESYFFEESSEPLVSIWFSVCVSELNISKEQTGLIHGYIFDMESAERLSETFIVDSSSFNKSPCHQHSFVFHLSRNIRKSMILVLKLYKYTKVEFKLPKTKKTKDPQTWRLKSLHGISFVCLDDAKVDINVPVSFFQVPKAGIELDSAAIIEMFQELFKDCKKSRVQYLPETLKLNVHLLDEKPFSLDPFLRKTFPSPSNSCSRIAEYTEIFEFNSICPGYVLQHGSQYLNTLYLFPLDIMLPSEFKNVVIRVTFMENDDLLEDSGLYSLYGSVDQLCFENLMFLSMSPETRNPRFADEIKVKLYTFLTEVTSRLSSLL